jgi:hypothetical protein
MPITSLKVLASLLQLHGQDATIQSDHEGIAALLNDLRTENSEELTQVISGAAALSEGDTEVLSAGQDIIRTGAVSAEAGSSGVTRRVAVLEPISVSACRSTMQMLPLSRNSRSRSCL